MEVGGNNVTGIINVPPTGGWQSWTTLPARVFTNTQPLTSFKVVVATAGFNLNWVRLDSAVPAAPGAVTAAATNTHVSLNWNPSTGATSYRIKRSTNTGGPYTTIANGLTTTSFADAGVTNGVTYYYVVAALNAYGEGPNSIQSASTVPFPKLAVIPASPNLLLSWPASASALVVNSTTNLAPPVVWLPVTNSPINQGGTWSVSLPVTGALRFFRLSAP